MCRGEGYLIEQFGSAPIGGFELQSAVTSAAGVTDVDWPMNKNVWLWKGMRDKAHQYRRHGQKFDSAACCHGYEIGATHAIGDVFPSQTKVEVCTQSETA